LIVVVQRIRNIEEESMLERFFKFQENGTTLRREIAGGVTTFMTMAYIIFVQPVVLAAAGMDLESVLVATCLSSALATFLIGILANYPIAQAPAMGHNFFFTYVVVLTLGYTWQQALGAIFISGSIFLILAVAGLWDKLITSLPASLKSAIAVGIGLLIAMVGMQWSGIVVDNPAFWRRWWRGC
jgi:AGZA family xanthine/uracil permease-like MFS transporter